MESGKRGQERDPSHFPKQIRPPLTASHSFRRVAAAQSAATAKSRPEGQWLNDEWADKTPFKEVAGNGKLAHGRRSGGLPPDWSRFLFLPERPKALASQHSKTCLILTPHVKPSHVFVAGRGHWHTGQIPGGTEAQDQARIRLLHQWQYHQDHQAKHKTQETSSFVNHKPQPPAWAGPLATGKSFTAMGRCRSCPENNNNNSCPPAASVLFLSPLFSSRTIDTPDFVTESSLFAALSSFRFIFFSYTAPLL